MVGVDRPGTLDTSGVGRLFILMGETGVPWLLLTPSCALVPSVVETRRGSGNAREAEGERDWRLVGGKIGMEIKDSMFLAEDDADALRGMGILEDLDGLVVMMLPISKAHFLFYVVCVVISPEYIRKPDQKPKVQTKEYWFGVNQNKAS